MLTRTAASAETTPVIENSEVEVGHRWPTGAVVIHDHISSAQLGVYLFGGEVVYRTCEPWQRAHEDVQVRWLTE